MALCLLLGGFALSNPVIAGSDPQSPVQESFLTLVPSSGAYAASIPEDIFMKPGRATTSGGTYSSDGIAKAIDGDLSTMYHSTNFTSPITLTFWWDGTTPTAGQIDYMIYNPRTSGTNGNFKEIEVWYRQKGGTLVHYKDYNFNGSSSPSVVYFTPALTNIDQIQIKVKSGMADGGNSNFASCAEMQFYKKNSSAFDTSDIFADAVCSELKDGITLQEINAIENEFFRQLALDIFQDKYDKEFRVQTYQSYPDPGVFAAKNKTAKYGVLDNPTGIYATAGEPLVVIVGEIADPSISPSLTIVKPWTGGERISYPLRQGVNKITPTAAGLIYIYYYTSTEAPTSLVKINIATGGVNGYFDIAKHTNADWVRLLAKAKYELFDMKGRYALISLQTSAYRLYCPTNGREILEQYDDLVYSEQEFEGMVKYDCMNPTRIAIITDKMKPGVGAYAKDYYTVYPPEGQSGLLTMTGLKDPNTTTGGTAWMLAHEIGHVNQTRPGLKWLGMTEVTNNILSQYITIKWGVKSRLQTEIIKNGKNRYQVAVEEIVKAEIAHISHGDVFCQLVPFWQLKLYVMDVLGKADFYKDLYEEIRINSNPVAAYGCTMDAMCQLEFVRIACKVSGYDLRSFFTDWGFLRPVNKTEEDYSTSQFTVTQQGIDYINAEIDKLTLLPAPVPSGKHIYEIDDNNKMTFKVN